MNLLPTDAAFLAFEAFQAFRWFVAIHLLLLLLEHPKRILKNPSSETAGIKRQLGDGIPAICPISHPLSTP
jgi:hypothetical protein